jgi:hypothetical protein
MRALPAPAVTAAILIASTLLFALVVFALGGRAAHGEPAGSPARNVVGMTLQDARRVLLAAGPVKIRVVRVPYGTAGEVQRVLGFEFDGTYNSRSTLTLQVGTKPAR